MCNSNILLLVCILTVSRTVFTERTTVKKKPTDSTVVTRVAFVKTPRKPFIINAAPDEYFTTFSSTANTKKIKHGTKPNINRPIPTLIPTDAPATLRYLNPADTLAVEITHFERNLSLEALIWYAADTNTKFLELPVLQKAERQFKNGTYLYRLNLVVTDTNGVELSCTATGYSETDFRNYEIDAAVCRTGKASISSGKFESLIDETDFKTVNKYMKGLKTKLSKYSVEYYKKQQKNNLGSYELGEVLSLRAKSIYANTQYQYITNFTMKVLKVQNKGSKGHRQVRKDKETWTCRSSAFVPTDSCQIIVNAVHCDCQVDSDAQRFKDDCQSTTSSTTNSTSSTSTSSTTTTSSTSTSSTTAKTTTTTRKSKTTKKNNNDNNDDHDNNNNNNNKGGDNTGSSGPEGGSGTSAATGGTSLTAGETAVIAIGGSAVTAAAGYGFYKIGQLVFGAAAAAEAGATLGTELASLGGLAAEEGTSAAVSFSPEVFQTGESSFLSGEGGINYGTFAEEEMPLLEGEINPLEDEPIFEIEENPAQVEEGHVPGEDGHVPGEEGEEGHLPVEENPFPEETVPEQENPFVENTGREVIRTGRWSKKLIAAVAGGVSVGAVAGVSILLGTIFGKNKAKPTDEYDGYAGTAGVEAMTSFQYMLAGLPFAKKQKQALPLKLYSYTRSLIMGRRLVYSVAYYIKLPKKPWRFCVTVGYHTDQFKDFDYVTVDCDHYVETQFQPYRKTRYETIARGKFSPLSIHDDDLLLKRIESSSAQYYMTNRRLFGKFEIRNAKEYRRRSLFNGGQYQYYLDFEIYNKTAQKKMDCISSVYRQKDFNLPYPFLELYVTAAHCDCLYDSDVHRFADIVKECGMKNKTVNTTNETPVDYIPKNVTVQVVDTTLFETTLAIDGMKAHWVKQGATNVTGLKITVRESVRGFYDDHYEYKMNIFVTNRMGKKFNCILLANVNWDFRRYLLVFSDCIYDGYAGKGLFSTEDFFLSSDKLPLIDKNSYYSIDNDTFMRQLGSLSVSHYTLKELLFDNYQLVDATRLFRKPVYENLHYNYFLSFKMKNVRTHKVWSCSSSVFASEDGTHLLPAAVHCDCVHDIDAYRFRFSYTDACDVSDTDTTVPPPLYEYTVIPDGKERVVEVTAFELMLVKLAVKMYRSLKPENIEVKEATRGFLLDHYGYKLKYQLHLSSGETYNCIAVARTSFNFTNYEIRIVDCSNSTNTGYDLYTEQEYLTKITHFGVIHDHEFTEIKTIGSVWNKILEESVNYYVQKESLSRPYRGLRIVDISSQMIYNGSQYQYFARFEMENSTNLEIMNCLSSVFELTSHREILVGAAHCDCRDDHDAHRFNIVTYCAPTRPLRDFNLPSINKQIVEATVFEVKLAQMAAQVNLGQRNLYIDFTEVTKMELVNGFHIYRLKFNTTVRLHYFYKCIALVKSKINPNPGLTYSEICFTDCTSEDGLSQYGLYNRQDYETFQKTEFDEIVKKEFRSFRNETLSISDVAELGVLSLRYYKRKFFEQYRLIGVKDLFVKLIEYEETQYQYFVRFDVRNNRTGETMGCSSSLFSDVDRWIIIANAVHCDCRNDSDSYRFKDSENCNRTATTTVATTTTEKSSKPVKTEALDATFFELQLIKTAAIQYWSRESSKWFNIIEVQRKRYEDHYAYRLTYQTIAPGGNLFECISTCYASLDYSRYNINFTHCQSGNYETNLFKKIDFKPSMKLDPVIRDDTEIEHKFNRFDENPRALKILTKNSAISYVRKEHLSNSYEAVRPISAFRRTTYNGTSYNYFLRFQTVIADSLEPSVCSSSLLTLLKHQKVLVRAVHCDCKNDSDSYRFTYTENCPTTIRKDFKQVALQWLEVELTPFEINWALVAADAQLSRKFVYTPDPEVDLNEVLRVLYNGNYIYKLKFNITINPSTQRFECIMVGKVASNFGNKNTSFTDCRSSNDSGYGMYRDEDYVTYKSIKIGLIAKSEFTPVDNDLNVSMLQKLGTNSVKYYKGNYQLVGIKDVLMKLIYEGTQYQYYVTFDMENTDTGDLMSCSSSVFADLSHRLLVTNAVHCDSRNDSDAHRLNDEDCSNRSTTATTTSVALVADRLNAETVEAGFFELNLIKTAVGEYWSLTSSQLEQFWLGITEVQRYIHGDQYRYKLIFQAAAPNGTLYKCISLGYVNYRHRMDLYHSSFTHCLKNGDFGRHIFKKTDFLPSNKLEQIIKKNSDVWNKFTPISGRNYEVEKLINESVIYYTRKESVHFYPEVKKIGTFRMINKGTFYNFFLRFRIQNVNTSETWICSSSVLTDSNVREILIRAVHCDCKNDSDAYRFAYTEYCPQDTARKAFARPSFKAQKIEVTTYEIKLAEQAADALLSHKTVYSNRTIDLNEVLRGLYNDQYIYKLKFNIIINPPTQRFECITVGKVASNFSYNETSFTDCRSLNDSEYGLYRQEDYATNTKTQFDIIADTEFTRVDNFSIFNASMIEKLGGKSVEYYKREDSDQYQLNGIKEVLVKLIYEETQYQYFVSFDLHNSRTGELTSCTSSVFASLSLQEVVVSAVHCNCRNDSDAYRFNYSCVKSTTTTSVTGIRRK